MNTETKTTINGDVHQDVPTDLTNVTINGKQPIRVKLSEEKIKILKEEGTITYDAISREWYYQFPKQVYKATEDESVFELVNKIITPIELPSDEEIEEAAEEVYPISKEYKEKLGANNYDDFNDCWNEGANWIKQHILNQNK